MRLDPGEAPHLASSHLSPDEAIRTFIQHLPNPCRLLVAFSGGGDSTGLLAALADARSSHPGLCLHAVTVDHGLRAGSAGEALAAARVSETLGVPHRVANWLGEKPATGIQAAARAARYGLLAAEARRIGADLIVTGHTFDDQMETIAMRRLRNPAGEAGMDDAVLIGRSVWVLRPFLAVRRQTIRRYLEERSLSWSEDPGNENPAFERVRIRRAGVDVGFPPKAPDRTLSELAAQVVRDRVAVHSSSVVTVDLSGFQLRHMPFRMALMTLISIVGGREHGPGGDVAENVVAKLDAGGNVRFTAGRVVIDRRKATLYLCREARGLETITIAPGETAIWDRRYEIGNAGRIPATIAAGRTTAPVTPLLPRAADSSLPGAVVRLAAETAPHLTVGDRTGIEVRPVLAPFAHFLPHHRFALADSLNMAFGLEHFPRLPLRISPFDT
jgi:tRNA(Ile)-lysidine synthase